jgi:hypothetical protein
VCLSVGCGGSKSEPKAAAVADDGRSRGFSKNDKARCEWEGRGDREVSEATAAGAFQPNIRRVYQIIGTGTDRRKVLICREVDTNLDGIKDVLRTFNDHGESLREEADTDFNGTVDSWITFNNGRIVKHELDSNGDGRPDRWKFYLQAKLSRIQRDTNFDGKPDVWEIYVRGNLERVGVDVDFDGRVDRWDRDESSRVAQTTKESEDKTEKSTDADAGASAKGEGGAASDDKE